MQGHPFTVGDLPAKVVRSGKGEQCWHRGWCLSLPDNARLAEVNEVGAAVARRRKEVMACCCLSSDPFSEPSSALAFRLLHEKH